MPYCSHCGSKNPDITFDDRVLTSCCLATPVEQPPAAKHAPKVRRGKYATFFEVAYKVPATHPVCIRSNYFVQKLKDKDGTIRFVTKRIKKFPKGQELPCIPHNMCPKSCPVYRRFLAYKKRIAKPRSTKVCIICGADICDKDVRRTICDNRDCKYERKRRRRAAKITHQQVCIVCEKPFTSVNPAKKTCSTDCSQALRAMTRQRTVTLKVCPWCGKEWRPYTDREFCTDKCEKSYLRATGELDD